MPQPTDAHAARSPHRPCQLGVPILAGLKRLVGVGTAAASYVHNAAKHEAYPPEALAIHSAASSFYSTGTASHSPPDGLDD